MDVILVLLSASLTIFSSHLLTHSIADARPFNQSPSPPQHVGDVSIGVPHKSSQNASVSWSHEFKTGNLDNSQHASVPSMNQNPSVSSTANTFSERLTGFAQLFTHHRTKRQPRNPCVKKYKVVTVFNSSLKAIKLPVQCKDGCKSKWSWKFFPELNRRELVVDCQP